MAGGWNLPGASGREMAAQQRLKSSDARSPAKGWKMMLALHVWQVPACS